MSLQPLYCLISRRTVPRLLRSQIFAFNHDPVIYSWLTTVRVKSSQSSVRGFYWCFYQNDLRQQFRSLPTSNKTKNTFTLSGRYSHLVQVLVNTLLFLRNYSTPPGLDESSIPHLNECIRGRSRS